jgi:sulfur carrier protein ThiS
MREVAVKVEMMIPEGPIEQGLHHPTAEQKFLWRGMVPEATTPAGLLEKLAVEHEIIREKVFDPSANRFRAEYMVILNGRFLPAEEMRELSIRENDEVTILPVPFGG